MTDPIADMLTRIRNAAQALHPSVVMPHSKLKESIARVLVSEGYLEDCHAEGEQARSLHLKLRYSGRRAAITGLRRVSKPGLRTYVGADEVPSVLGGLGVPIISTSRGVMTGRAARKAQVGGEVLCYVW